MPESPKQWEATIWVGDPEEPMTFSGATLGQLRAVLTSWFGDHEQKHFANLPQNDPKRISYHIKPSSGPEILNPDDASIVSEWKDFAGDGGWETSGPFSKIAARFIAEDVIFSPGPDYQETAVQDGVFQMHRIKTVRLEALESQSQIARINELLQRGWYILKLNEVRESTPQMLLGHVEPDAF